MSSPSPRLWWGQLDEEAPAMAMAGYGSFGYGVYGYGHWSSNLHFMHIFLLNVEIYNIPNWRLRWYFS
jgi:hypothetical protein